MMLSYRSRIATFVWNRRLRREHTASRVAGTSAQSMAITEAAAHAVLTREDCRVESRAAAKATIEREATRAWARERREKLGIVDSYDSADLAFGLVERRTLPDYRPRFPMWQRVLYLEENGIYDEEAAEFIGTDPLTVAFELPVAYAHLAA